MKYRIPVLFGLLLAVSAAFAEDKADKADKKPDKKQQIITSVYSKRSPAYRRQTQPDGSFKKEYYVIANGKYEPGNAPNASIEKVKFPEIMGLMSDHLAKKGYLLADKADGASLLLLVTWGTTRVFGSGDQSERLANLSGAMNANREALDDLNRSNASAAQAASPEAIRAAAARQSAAQSAAFAANDSLSNVLLQNQLSESARSKFNEDNAKLLGYVDELNNRNDMSRFAGAGATYDDLVSDIESERYYVRITAYDFKKLQRDQKQDVLWTTVVSIETRGTRFDEALSMMVANAARQFGQSNGLVREAQDGTVNLGELQVLGEADSTRGAKPAPKDKK